MTEKGADSDSLEARVAEEHDQLEPLFEATRVGLARSETSTALEAIADLRAALESHTAQEDHLYYPALWSLCPQHKDALQIFIRSHEQFRAELGEIVQCVAGGDLRRAETRFQAFSQSFANHEVYEEELLRKIDAENPWGDPRAAS